MTALHRLEEFFFVYFDKKTSRKVALHPEMAIPLLRESISAGLPTHERLHVYAAALRDAVAIQGLGSKAA